MALQSTLKKLDFSAFGSKTTTPAKESQSSEIPKAEVYLSKAPVEKENFFTGLLNKVKEPVVSFLTGLSERERKEIEYTPELKEAGTRLPFGLEKTTIRPPKEVGLIKTPIELASRLVELIPKAVVQTVQNYRDAQQLGTAEPLALAIDPRRLGFKEPEVKSTGQKLGEKFDKFTKENPPLNEWDNFKNALKAAFTTVVPDAFDVFVAGDLLDLSAKIVLKATKFDPVLEDALLELGLDKNKEFSLAAVKDRFLSTAQTQIKAGDFVGFNRALQNLNIIANRYGGKGIVSLNRWAGSLQRMAKKLSFDDLLRLEKLKVLAPPTGLPGYAPEPGPSFGLSIKKLREVGRGNEIAKTVEGLTRKAKDFLSFLSPIRQLGIEKKASELVVKAGFPSLLEFWQSVQKEGPTAALAEAVEVEKPKALQEKIEQAEAETLIELDLAEAGKRLAIPTEELGVDYTFLAQKSTFPQWIPEKLRLKELTDKVMDSIVKGQAPRAGSRARELYNVVLHKIAEKAGVPFSDLVKPEAPIIKINLAKVKQAMLKPYRQKVRATLKGVGLAPEKKMIITDEGILLRQRLRAEVKGARQGYKAGRRKLFEQIRERKLSVEEIRQSIVDFAKKQLPLRERGKLLAKIKNAYNFKDLSEAKDYVDNLKEASDKRALLEQIKKELQEPLTLRGGKGKYDPDVLNKLASFKDSISFDTPQDLQFKKLEKVNAWVSEHPTEDLPEDLVEELDALERSHLKLLNADELSEQLGSIRSLKATGKTLKQIQILERKLDRDRVVADFENIITKGEGVKPEMVLPERKNIIKKIKGFLDKFVKQNLNPDNTLDILDEASKLAPYKGAIHQKFSQLVQRARDAQIRGQHDTLKEVSDKLKEFDLEKTLNDKVEIRNKVLTRNELLDIYISSHDTAKLASMIEGNKLSQDFINQAIAELTEDERAFGDFLLDFYEASYEPMNQVYRKVNFVDLPKNKGYSPMFKDLKFVKEEDINLAKQQLDYARASVKGKGRTKLRTGSLAPVKLDALGNLVRFVNQTEHYKAFELASREMSSILSGVKKAVYQEYGTDFYQLLRRWLEDVASDGRYTLTDVDKFFLALRRNFTKSVLGLNLITSIKQTISLSAFLTAINEKELTSGLASYWLHKKEWDGFWDKVPQVAQRSETLTRDIAQVTKDRKAVDAVFRRKGMTEKTLSLIRLFDKLTVRSGATAVYLAKGGARAKFDETAITETLRVVRLTQPTGSIENLAGLQRGGVLAKLLTQFQNQPNKYFNLIYHNIRAYSKGRTGKGQLARALLYAWIIPSVIFEFISSGGKADEEDYLLAVGLGPLNYLLVLGNVFRAIKDGFDYDLAPVAQVPEDFVRESQKLLKGDIFEAMLGFTEVGLTASGLPVNQPKRTITGIKDLLEGKTDDWRRLIWSDYVLREKKGQSNGAGPTLNIEIPSLNISIPDISIPSITF